MGKGPLDPRAKMALNQMKEEIAKDYKITYSKDIYNGDLSSRNNGKIGGSLGGHMTRKLVEMAEESLITKNK